MSYKSDELKAKMAVLAEELKQSEAHEEADRRRKFLLNATREDVAYLLHEKTCRANHTDGCSFGYDWHYGRKAEALKDYLPKADLMLKVAAAGTIIEILELL